MKLLFALLFIIVCLSSFAGDVVIYPTTIVTANGAAVSGCTGGYVGYAKYKKPVPNYGWVPDTNNFNFFTITDTNATIGVTKVQYLGRFGDFGCNEASVSLQMPPPSDKYSATVYFTNTNDIPASTNSHPIVFRNFLP